MEEVKTGCAKTAGTAKTPEGCRILLSEVASKTLLEIGECFVIAGKTSHPEQPGRIVIHLVPIPKKQADDACLVAMGQARAVKPKAPKP